ncbi:hypothetical protein P8C59_006759 [Phyllachora maydis]|uniref:Uncharacterized protein n=1 Tax=Phyllachora maydis TaxID=1825666 RepID=A0AAD9I8U1_9PEZI|nr:hypothetical protein P8C59_006759 [Phyllachora maydis]
MRGFPLINQYTLFHNDDPHLARKSEAALLDMPPVLHAPQAAPVPLSQSGREGRNVNGIRFMHHHNPGLVTSHRRLILHVLPHSPVDPSEPFPFAAAGDDRGRHSSHNSAVMCETCVDIGIQWARAARRRSIVTEKTKNAVCNGPVTATAWNPDKHSAAQSITAPQAPPCPAPSIRRRNA